MNAYCLNASEVRLGLVQCVLNENFPIQTGANLTYACTQLMLKNSQQAYSTPNLQSPVEIFLTKK